MAVTNRDKFNRKYKKPKGTSHSRADISRLTGIPSSILTDVYKRGIGAYRTNPSSVRPSVSSKEQWAMGRVYSFVMKQPGTWGRADKDLAEKVKKKKIKGYVR